jgi:hypothetical protein
MENFVAGRSFLISLLLYGALSGAPPARAQEHPQTELKGTTTVELGAMIARKAPISLATTPVAVHIAMNKDSSGKIAAALTPGSKTKIVLALYGIDFDKLPEVHYQIYLNLPQNERPDYKSIYFVGNLALFSFHPHGGTPGQPPHLNFDITKTVRELKSRNLWDGSKSSVTFVVQWLVDANERPLPVPAGVRLRFAGAKILAIEPQS